MSPDVGSPVGDLVPPDRVSRSGRSVVELVGVSKVYPNTRDAAVADVTLTVEEGEFFALLGPSGSGKTTTLRMIAGFERPTVGCVRLAGRDVTKLPPYKRDVNTVFQNYALFPHMRVADNVAYPLKFRSVGKAETASRVSEALDRVGMTGFERRLPHQLSGGQRQRVALARALISRPALVLLDEPLGALDLKLRQSMQLMLKRLQREVGITFVYVTHDQGEALAMSDRLAVMHDGRIHQTGAPDEVYFRPKTTFVASFIGKTNLVDAERDATGAVRAGGLALRLATTPAAEQFKVSIRPESILLAEAAEGAANTFDGIVRETIFLGSERELIVEVSGQTLLAKAASNVVLEAGTPIRVGWPAEACVVVVDPAEQAP